MRRKCPNVKTLGRDEIDIPELTRYIMGVHSVSCLQYPSQYHKDDPLARQPPSFDGRI